MSFSMNEIIALLNTYLLPLFRIAAMFSIVPIFGSHQVPRRIKIGIAVAFTIVVAPVIPKAAPVDPFSILGVALILNQILIGLAIGFCITLLFGILVMAGQLISQLMGLSFANMMDPQNGIPVPAIGQFYTIMATLIFLSINGHLMIIQLLVNSFYSIPISDHLLNPIIWKNVAGLGSLVFSGALLIAIPAVAALLIVNIAFGVMSRSAPQLNIFAVGFPVMILFGFVVMLMTLPLFVMQFSSLVNEVFSRVGTIFM